MEQFDIVNEEDDDLKMVIVTRDDMSPGYQLVQSVHGLADFAVEHPEAFRNWQSGTNTLACLSVPDEDALEKLLQKLTLLGVPLTPFREPDVNHQLTSFCILGTEEIRAKLRYLTPALKGGKNEAIRMLTRGRKATTTA